MKVFDYRINLNNINNIIDFKIKKELFQDKFKLEIHHLTNMKIIKKIKKFEMVIEINSCKNKPLKIVKSSIEEYKNDENKKIKFGVNKMNINSSLCLGIIFDTNDLNSIEFIKISYRFMV